LWYGVWVDCNSRGKQLQCHFDTANTEEFDPEEGLNEIASEA